MASDLGIADSQIDPLPAYEELLSKNAKSHLKLDQHAFVVEARRAASVWGRGWCWITVRRVRRAVRKLLPTHAWRKKDSLSVRFEISITW